MGSLLDEWIAKIYPSSETHTTEKIEDYVLINKLTLNFTGTDSAHIYIMQKRDD